MKAWHVTGWAQPIPFFPCRVFLWGWIRPISIGLGMVLVPFCLCGQLGPGWILFWLINLEDSNSLQRDPCVGRWFSWHLSREGFLSMHLERCVWLLFRQRDKWTCLLLAKLGFFLQGLHRPIWRKDTIAWNSWRITSRGFFLNGTWSWPRRCSSNISSCLKVVGGNTHNVDVWLSLSNLLHCVNRNSRSNLWRDTWSIPNDPTGCRCLFSLKLGQDGQGREKGWRVVKNSCRVLLV